jgi:hypothetical protein
MHMYIVGSQCGYIGSSLDDCIIHGMFVNEQDARACVSKLRVRNPRDAYAIAHVPMNKEVHVSFATGDWQWIGPLESDSSDMDSIESLCDPEPWGLCMDARRRSAQF